MFFILGVRFYLVLPSKGGDNQTFQNRMVGLVPSWLAESFFFYSLVGLTNWTLPDFVVIGIH